MFALITGASGGIGEAFAEQFARDGIDVLLVARDKLKLESVAARLRSEYHVRAEVYSADLTQVDAVHEVWAWATAQGDVEYLINNAGFGDKADVIDADPQRLQEMIRLNNEALVLLSQSAAKDMTSRHKGYIVNIASIAALAPGPGMAVYYASKAFVVSFTQALAWELRGSGVTVTAVCPAPTASGFAVAARATNTRIFKGTLPTSQAVASFGYKAMRRGDLVAIWGSRNRFVAKIIGLLPRRFVLKSVRRLQ